MHALEVFQHFEHLPVFSLSDVNQIINNRMYAKKFLSNILHQGKIFKIKRNAYTLHADSFLVSTFLVKPSYISSISALSYHKLITQIPKEIFCATSKHTKRFAFTEPIHFFHTKYFFGFAIVDYEQFSIPVADPEKAIIDSFSLVPVSLFEEAFENIDEQRMIEYLRKIKKSSIIKRVGYLLEKHGYKVYDTLKHLINYKYIPLDPLIKQKGAKDKKWGIIINTP